MVFTVLDAFLAISEDFSLNFFSGGMAPDPPSCLTLTLSRFHPHSKTSSTGPALVACFVFDTRNDSLAIGEL